MVISRKAPELTSDRKLSHRSGKLYHRTWRAPFNYSFEKLFVPSDNKFEPKKGAFEPRAACMHNTCTTHNMHNSHKHGEIIATTQHSVRTRPNRSAKLFTPFLWRWGLNSTLHAISVRWWGLNSILWVISRWVLNSMQGSRVCRQPLICLMFPIATPSFLFKYPNFRPAEIFLIIKHFARR